MAFEESPYRLANFEGGCCISDKVFAERCHCWDVSEDHCSDICKYDSNCRAYVNKINGDCQAITTTSCDHYSKKVKCKKFDVGNIADLDLKATCGNGYNGCTIKRIGNILLYLMLIVCLLKNIYT